ncbi:HAMP domain-containing sensor histidine kinase [Sphingomonas sp. PB2P19]|uniref:HAMP domain-containing sensor histidine kinase n=1 Tax=Sphingomonas rhamnosi TaxID=3096156 RepID=UPI002FC789F3
MRRPRPVSLGAKLVLIMTSVGAAGALAITLLLACIIMPSFETLEVKAIASRVERTGAALARIEAHAEIAARDYGSQRLNPDSMERLAGPPVEHDTGAPGLAYVRSNGGTVLAYWRDPRTGADRPAMRRALLAAIVGFDLPVALAGRNARGFYARVGNGVAAIGLARVLGVEGAGPPGGYVVVAHMVSARRLSQQLGLRAQIDAAAVGDSVTVTKAHRTLSIAVPMIGVDRHAVAAARLDVPREVALLGARVLLLAVAGSILLLLLVLVVLRRLIARLVLRPLRRIEDHMQRVPASGSLALLQEDGREDEIGALGRSFNTMLQQLRDLRERLEVQSFDLGRSESAVTVMHNVRNALNPISTILSQGLAQEPPIDRTVLDRAVAELARDDVPPARRDKLAAFVTAAIEADDHGRSVTRRELAVGREAMTHVLDIIGQQQRAAHERPMLEVCDVTDIIARNATIARYAEGASIAFSFPSEPHYVLASRVILSQVIGNVFGNAAESIVARGRGSGTIAATVHVEDGHVALEIRDDGEGFSPEIGALLFQRGFSTRAHKSGGLGLHWCANSMTAMGGGLRLSSEGWGCGAVAILTLPAANAESAGRPVLVQDAAGTDIIPA